MAEKQLRRLALGEAAFGKRGAEEEKDKPRNEENLVAFAKPRLLLGNVARSRIKSLSLTAVQRRYGKNDSPNMARPKGLGHLSRRAAPPRCQASSSRECDTSD